MPVKIITLLMLVSLAVSCGRNSPGSGGSAGKSTAGPSIEQEQWLKENQIGKYDIGTQDWEAIEAAAVTEGALVIYTNSSSIAMAADSWAELYPDIALIVNDSDDITVMMAAEQDSGKAYGDVWFGSDDSNLIGKLLPHQYIRQFVPDTLTGKIASEYTEPLLVFHFGTTVLAYNRELNETCPVNNIWELTQPEWKGRIFIEDPLTDTSTLYKLLTYVCHAEELKAAYIDLYKAEPVLDADTPDAGWLWLKRFVRNAPIPLSSSREVETAFASPGMKNSYLAFTSYSGYADVLEGNLAFEPCWGIKPVSGTLSRSCLAIINLAPHPNAAKLFIRFITSDEGRKPWAKFGRYFTDSSYQVPAGQMNFEEILKVTWFTEDQFAYDNMIQALDLYLLNLQTR